ncbi:hypothetical protein EDB80DRAFT_681371 [Ilyonectria destructans]|nr:hypothetical protein EDB80DRAFT_681371 [Ilyonectria destructans]
MQGNTLALQQMFLIGNSGDCLAGQGTSPELEAWTVYGEWDGRWGSTRVSMLLLGQTRETRGNVVVVVFQNKRSFSFVPDEASANALDEAFGLRGGRLLAAAQRKSEPTVADSLLSASQRTHVSLDFFFNPTLVDSARGARWVPANQRELHAGHDVVLYSKCESMTSGVASIMWRRGEAVGRSVASLLGLGAVELAPARGVLGSM